MSTPEDQRGSPSATEEVQLLFVRHENSIRTFVRALQPSLADADDVLQETFLTVSRKASTFELGTNFVAWACSIARLKVLENFRQKKRSNLLSEAAISALAADAPAAESLTEREDALEKCLGKLAPKARDLLWRRYSRRQSSDYMGTSKGNSVMKELSTSTRLLLVLLLIYSFQAIAAETLPKANEDSAFTKADVNNDGRLGPEEFKNETLFQQMDANSNGFVSRKEAQSFIQRRRARENAGGAKEASGRPVFPASTEDEAAKRKLLSTIADITSGDTRPPNIVLLFADDLGYGDTSLYGSEKIPTPNIDALGKQGVRFSNAYVTAASCSPSRAGLMSGQYQQRFGFEFNTAGGATTHRSHRGLDPSVVTMADVLKQAGYVTGMFGKWHLGTQPQFHPQARGFDEFYGFLAGAHSFFPAKNPQPFHSTIMRDTSPLIEPEYLTDAIARETVTFIDANYKKPFFAYVPFNAVHTPIEAIEKYQDRFPNESNQTKRDYYAMTSALDDAVGAIVAAINKHGLADNTLVIFVNDNGGPIYTGVQSNGPLKLGKLFLFEGGIRVPMIIKLPGTFEPNSVYDQPASTLDLFPTICHAAGIKLPPEISLDGVDLTPFIKGTVSGSPHDTLFWSNGPNIAVRHGDWKLVKSYDSTWLFHLASDIVESKNLAQSKPEIVEQLETLYHEWRSQMSEPAWPSKPNRRKVEVDGLVYEMNI